MSEAFSSINFLFLISLAFTSWILLCYLKGVQEEPEHDIKMDLNIDSAPFEETLQDACQDNYDVYINFVCIFACIYTLAKVSQFTENYFAKYLRANYCNTVNKCDVDENQSVREMQNLQQKIELLEKQNNDLEEVLENLQQRDTLMLDQSTQPSSELSTTACSSSTTTTTQQNIYISNRHIHMTRQVYVNEGNIKLSGPNAEQGEGGDFSRIWQKYLEMQKYAIQTPEPNAMSPSEPDNATPVVLSTEDLHAMQGGFWTMFNTIRRL